MIRAIVDRYLNAFPADRGALSLLSEQLSLRERLDDRHNFRGHVTASATVFDQANGLVLLIHHRGLDKWLQPGGHCDPGESPQAAAGRELAEETGLSESRLHPWHAETGIPLEINTHLIPARSERNEPQHQHHDFRYVFLADPSEAVALDTEEVSAHKWVAPAHPAIPTDLKILTGRMGDYLGNSMPGHHL